MSCNIQFSACIFAKFLFSNKWKLALSLLPHFRFCLLVFRFTRIGNQTTSKAYRPSLRAQALHKRRDGLTTHRVPLLPFGLHVWIKRGSCSCCWCFSCCWLLLLNLGSRSQLSSSQWTMHQSISLSFHAVPHRGYFPASRQIAVEEHKRWAVSMWCRRRERSPRSDASFVRLQRNLFSPSRWSIHQAHPDICQKPSLTSTVWRSSADQWLSC